MACSLVLLLAVLITGCASREKVAFFDASVEADTNKATVYLYRGNVFSLKDAYPFVFIDDSPQGELEHLTYMTWELDPGQYEWTVKAGDVWDEMVALDIWDIREKKITLDVEAGKYYFLRIKPRSQPSTFGWRDAKLELINKAKALKEINDSTLSNVK